MTLWKRNVKKKRKRSIDWYNEAAANQKFIVDEDIKKKCCVLYRSDANVLYTSRSEPLIMAFSAHDSDSLCCLPWSKPRVCNSLTYKPVDPGGWASENNIKNKKGKEKQEVEGQLEYSHNNKHNPKIWKWTDGNEKEKIQLTGEDFFDRLFSGITRRGFSVHGWPSTRKRPFKLGGQNKRKDFHQNMINGGNEEKVVIIRFTPTRKANAQMVDSIYPHSIKLYPIDWHFI